jgi:hypothetical protein
VKTLSASRRPLADGIVSGSACVPAARLQGLPGYGQRVKPEVCVRVDTFPVRVENGVILVAIDGMEEKAA